MESPVVEAPAPTTGPQKSAGKTWARRRRRAQGMPFLYSMAVIPMVVIVGLLVVVVWTSFQASLRDPALTVGHYVNLFDDPFAFNALRNTLGFSAVAVIVAFLIGVPSAWIAERTDLPGRNAIHPLMMVALFIPSFFVAMGFIFLLDPRFGVVNRWLMDVFGFQSAPINIVSLTGMGIVQGLGLVALVFIFASAAFRSMDGSLEEAARMSGASWAKTVRIVTLPLAWPGLLAALIFVLTIAVSSFDIPLVMGLTNRIYVFSTFLLVGSSRPTVDGIPNYGLVAAFGTLMIIFALVLSTWYGRVLSRAKNYQVVTGKGYRPRLVHLSRRGQIGAWLFVGGYFVLSKLVPLLLIGWASLLPFFQGFSIEAFGRLSFANYSSLPWDLVKRGLTNTLVIALVAPVLTVLGAFLFSWIIVKSKNRLRYALDFVSFLPNVVPAAVFGLAALVSLLFYVRDIPFVGDLYGTRWILITLYVVMSLSFATRVTNTALLQIHDDLDGAARMSGASGRDVARLIIAPLIRPALVYLWLWIVLIVLRELTLATFLVSPENVTLPVVIWNLWSTGEMGKASAVNLMMMAVFLPMVALFWRYGRRGQTDAL